MLMTRSVMTLVLVCASAAAQASGTSNIQAHSENPVVAWNRILLSIVRTPGAQPPTIHPTRSFAMMHAAIYDAVNAIDRTHTVYVVSVPGASRHASQGAAAAAAAHDVLAALYPAFASTLDTELQQSLQVESEDGDQAAGVHIGRAVAERILAIRNRDGSDAQPGTYIIGTAPGNYQPTPPDFRPQPQFTHWPFVTPFALTRADQFRPQPPPALVTDRYAGGLDEIESVGVAHSMAATPDEAETGLFWNGAIQNYWNEIAQTASIARHLSTAQSARLFALLNLSLADGAIALYDAKYAYNLWRPVTAIRAADLDDNPDTTGDPNWLPETGKTAPDPSYPGAHAVISAAAAEVLTSVMKQDRFAFDVTSEVTPDMVRPFTSFSSAAEEASLSRIFAGQHFRFDQTSGQRLGGEVADFVVDHFLTRIQDGSNVQ
jgi:hypothetical protein